MYIVTMTRAVPRLTLAFVLLVAPQAASAASGHGIDGSAIGLYWIVPFMGLLLSIAMFPLLLPRFWEHHFGKVGLFWSLCFVLPCLLVLGPQTIATDLVHVLVAEYVPFMILLFTLFVVAGGILVSGNFAGTPSTNTLLLAAGTALASVLGTTGASMLLIRTVIRANAWRRHKVHVFVFFIFLVSNIGGSLTPLGDPPLFLGFLKGVDFLWTVTAMFMPMMVCAVLLLVLFYLFDRRAWRSEAHRPPEPSDAAIRVRIEGWRNFFLLGVALVAIVGSGVWNPGISIPFGFGIERSLQGLARDVILIGVSIASLQVTPKRIRIENAFHWAPMQEVAFLFAAIFVTMVPALAILSAGSKGALAPLLAFVTSPDGKPVDAAYFWLTGGLSSFLDNAPTYLVFFNLAGGNPQQLMGPLASTLLAISAGAVFMGANTYIGNAPNFMVRSICEEQGIRMPSFFGYMAWSGVILLPLFVLVTFLFFA